jgi:hypothetical protein
MVPAITTREQEYQRYTELRKLSKRALAILYTGMGTLTPEAELMRWRKDEILAQILYVERGYRDQVPA